LDIDNTESPMTPDYPKPPFPAQKQPMPGSTDAMQPRPDHGETSYKGSGKLKGMKAVITGGDSGIGRAVAIAFAREGADVLIAFLNETEEANEVKKLVEKEGRKAVLVAGDLQDAKHCREVIKKAVDDLGGIDILVNNAAHQATFKDIGDISDEEWEKTFRTNIHSMFYLTKAAVPHMKPGSAIINTASVNSDMPNPMLLAYATTKGAIQNFTGGLAQMLAEKGIRANAVAPGPIWTPLIPSTMPDDAVKNFGKQVPMKRPGQPAELATTYVMLADPLSSYTSGTTIAVTAESRSSDGRPQASRNPGRTVFRGPGQALAAGQSSSFGDRAVDSSERTDGCAQRGQVRQTRWRPGHGDGRPSHGRCRQTKAGRTRACMADGWLARSEQAYGQEYAVRFMVFGFENSGPPRATCSIPRHGRPAGAVA
jgi:NAD(P)-dependent dehydrogenase (short-subunit alcohol dehydrogenase family)